MEVEVGKVQARGPSPSQWPMRTRNHGGERDFVRLAVIDAHVVKQLPCPLVHAAVNEGDQELGEDDRAWDGLEYNSQRKHPQAQA